MSQALHTFTDSDGEQETVRGFDSADVGKLDHANPLNPWREDCECCEGKGCTYCGQTGAVVFAFTFAGFSAVCVPPSLAEIIANEAGWKSLTPTTEGD